MVICLGWPLPATSSSLPAAGPSSSRTRERCGSHLAAYLALLRLGVTVPPLLPAARWALTPPFHPYPASSPRGGEHGGLLSVAFPAAFGPQAVTGRPPGGAWAFLQTALRPSRHHHAPPAGEIITLRPPQPPQTP